jgi:hypothetical protein
MLSCQNYNMPYSSRLDLEDDCFFLTQKVYFGRGLINDVRKGVGSNPLYLEKHDSHYVPVSHTFIKGIMDWQAVLPA